MTRPPGEKPPSRGSDDRFIPVEEVNLAQAEILGEYVSDSPEFEALHFPVIRYEKRRARGPIRSTEPRLKPSLTPSEAILRSRTPKIIRRAARPLLEAPLAFPVIGQQGPPLPILFISAVVLLALAL
ncbi:MAG: hypothetical protein LDL33_04795 [Desulfomonile sp.]|nr:hypothetical protein [Desulfomonile sp.]